MSSPDSSHPVSALTTQIEALNQALELARDRLDDDVVDSAQQVVVKAKERMRHGSAHCVIALVGPTGSGKSTIFNALAGAEISTSGIRRPTTSETHAVTWSDDASELLDWLEIKRRHGITSGAQSPFEGLVLLDLPDFDSTEAANQTEVDRLVELVDLLIWIVEPQKYADQALHAGYLQPLAGHANVMRFVLSKVDTLSDSELGQALPDFTNVLRTDGIDDPQVVPVSVHTGQGLEELSQIVALAVAERRSTVERLSADMRRSAITLGHSENSEPAESVMILKRDRAVLLDGLGRAAGVDEAASVVAKQYRRDAGLATGWPPTRWLARLRRSPSRELPRPGRSAVAGAEVGSALRLVGDAAAADLPRPWDSSIRRLALNQADSVRGELAQVNVTAMRDLRQKPRWWSAANWLQRVAGLVAGAGAIWLIVLAVVGGLLRLDTDAMTPMVWDWMPLPTLLLLGAALVGILIALGGRSLAVLGGKRRGRKAAAIWRDRVADVAERAVLQPLERALDEQKEFARLLEIAAGRTD